MFVCWLGRGLGALRFRGGYWWELCLDHGINGTQIGGMDVILGDLSGTWRLAQYVDCHGLGGLHIAD